MRPLAVHPEGLNAKAAKNAKGSLFLRAFRGLRVQAGPRGFLWVLAAAAFLAAPARAQTAPAGNAHPETQPISQGGAGLANAFGEPAMGGAAAGIAEKHAFSQQVDLSPLRSLAVQHDGRVKVLDTLARETVVRIAGRKTYQDFLPAPQGDRLKKLDYDPLFTFLDLLIDPWYYADKPLVHIEYFPLRERYVELAFPQNRAEQEKWLKFTRLSPRMIVVHEGAIRARHEFDQPYRDGLNRAMMALEVFNRSSANLLLVAPVSTDAEYSHLSTLAPEHAARRAALALGAAWRSRDAAGANAAIRTLAEELPKINPQVYPTTRRDIEIAYNRANAFEWGYWLYAAAFLTLILAFGTGRRALVAIGIATLLGAVLLHGFGFITRCIIAERFAIQNQFESMTGLSFFAAIAGLGIMVARRQWLYGAAAAGVGFLVLITATQTAIPGKFIEREAAILNTSVLLKYHVTTVLCSYGLISLGFIVSLFYLATHYAGRFRPSPVALDGGGGRAPARPEGADSPVPPSPSHIITRSAAQPLHPPTAVPSTLAAAALNLPADAPAGRARTLSDLDKAQMTVLQLAFWTLGVGILLGAWWADHSWGRWWAFDPKETWALATWIIYLIVIHLRFTTGRNRGLVTAWLSVLGFVVMLWTYFGVNLLLPGLHAYA
ncbi:MAG: cytochrome c biogenesis protein CcsA [Phycisphaerales bacterium]